jgi:histidinol phosphatase-like PHP family hydrolase
MGSGEGSGADLGNAEIAELLAAEAEKTEGQVRMAFKRAARLSFIWPVEVTELLERGEPLTALPGIGPFIEKRIRNWVDAGMLALPVPGIRSDFITIPEARRILARQPAWRTHYRGDLQMHTTWSDGSGTIHEMADAALELGYAYVGITDHSKGLKIAGGINEGHLERQRIEIDAVNHDLRARSFRVLHGIELNLNPQGEGDMNPSAIAKLDYVVGSFHSALRRSGDQTARYIAALENPDIQILGHPRGRIYNHREGLQADWPRVFAKAAELDKAVEIDAYPDRQDLNVELLKIARREDVRIAIDTDAHAPAQLLFVELGLAAAVRAGLPRDRIINFMSVPSLLKWVQQVRSRARRKRAAFVLELESPG